MSQPDPATVTLTRVRSRTAAWLSTPTTSDPTAIADWVAHTLQVDGLTSGLCPEGRLFVVLPDDGRWATTGDPVDDLAQLIGLSSTPEVLIGDVAATEASLVAASEQVSEGVAPSALVVFLHGIDEAPGDEVAARFCLEATIVEPAAPAA